MQKLFVVLLTVLICLVSPLIGQEKASEKQEQSEMPAPPPPLDDEWMNWMVGEWQGWSEGAMGKSEDWMSCEMNFGDQYMVINVKSKGAAGPYTGAGAFTLNDKGEIEAVWVDSFRDMAKGTGTRVGNVMTMVWEGKMGKYTRVTEKVDADHFKVSGKWETADGKVMEGKSEMTRVKENTSEN